MASPDFRSPNMADLLEGLSSYKEGAQKMAAFKLQTLTNDPAFAEGFVAQGGLARLRDVILESSGNTLAYSLASFARLHRSGGCLRASCSCAIIVGRAQGQRRQPDVCDLQIRLGQWTSL